MATTPSADLPSTTRAEYDAALPDVTLCRDFLAGTRRVHAKALDYLPKYEKEKDKKYQRRSTAAKVYGGYGRTVSASVGMIFGKPPALSEALQEDGALADHWENIDLTGTDGAVFCKRFAEDCIADGDGFILVDYAPTPDPETTTITAEDAARLNLRPFWRRYQRLDCLSWRTGVINGKLVPTQIVLREAGSETVGEFGNKMLVQYRVLRVTPVTDQQTKRTVAVANWAVLVEDTAHNGDKTVRVVARGFFRDQNGVVFDEIPLAVGYGGRSDAPFTARPPLLDVAWSNLAYWRKETNLTYYEDLCAFPMIHTRGMAVDAKGLVIPIEFGPQTHIATEADGDAKWVELTGTSSTVLSASMEREKRDMAELGMSFLAPQSSAGVESYKAKALDAAAENATISTTATGIEDAINQALVFHARYLGVAKEAAPSITLNRDFEAQVMDAPTMLAYVTAISTAGLPIRLLLEAWQRGGRIPEDADLDKIEGEMEAGLKAAEDDARIAQENAAAAVQAKAGGSNV